MNVYISTVLPLVYKLLIMLLFFISIAESSSASCHPKTIDQPLSKVGMCYYVSYKCIFVFNLL